MQRSSETIAKLASALAKAQIELVNPEKSLVATIYPEGANQEARTFNYASLASGLEIVRKTLGQHEIATVQSSSIDEAAQIVKLTTVLAHASGEWISSDWPVCAVADTAAPRRMGAALTYARRYALFTLVGIAGEDDLDAPDVQATAPNTTPNPTSAAGAEDGKASSTAIDGCNGRPRDRRSVPQRPNRPKVAPARRTLETGQSAALCGRLVAELNEFGTADELAHWAKRCLSEKNKLTTGDARRIEEAFTAKLAACAMSDSGQPADPLGDLPGATAPSSPRKRSTPDTGACSGTSQLPQFKEIQRRIDKSGLTLPEPRRLRDRDHLKHAAQQLCLACGRTPCDAHHLSFAQIPALGRKVSDEFTVPLCRGHHRELHRQGNELAWWRSRDIDPIAEARVLWLQTHPLLQEATSPPPETAPFAAATTKAT